LDRLKYLGKAAAAGLVTLALAYPACSADEGAPGGTPSTSGGKGGADASTGGTSGSGGSNTGGTPIIDAPVKPPCNKGLGCDVPECPEGKTTSLKGAVYAPDGKLPLYNAVVYVPRYTDRPLTPIVPGASCQKCDAQIENAISTALTNPIGSFELKDLPAGVEMPLIVQVGKWRRQVTIPALNACEENILTDPELSRLPRNQSEGDMPRIANVTGGCDRLGCLFSKLGVDAAEFTNSGGNGRIHVFKGVGGGDVTSGGALPAQDALWNDLSSLSKYDLVILSCECGEYDDRNKLLPGEAPPGKAKERMRDYLNIGGRLFASHFGYTWFKNGPAEMAGLANWDTSGASTASPFRIDLTFPKGAALLVWMKTVATIFGNEVPLTDVRTSFSTVYPPAQRWIYGVTSGGLEVTKYFTVNAPIGADPEFQCGRAVLTDLHVSENSGSGGIPASCSTGGLSDQEKALAFLLFDLAACVLPDEVEPEPPVPVPQ
jgi:hypothetical protein